MSPFNVRGRHLLYYFFTCYLLSLGIFLTLPFLLCHINNRITTFFFDNHLYEYTTKKLENYMFSSFLQEAQIGFEPMNQGVADPRLTTWLLRLILYVKSAYSTSNDSNGNRTRVTAVKGRCLNRLTMEPYYSFRLCRL